MEWLRAVVAGKSGRGSRFPRLYAAQGAVLVVMFLAMGAAPVLAASVPYSDGTTQTPVAIVTWEATQTVPVSLSDAQISALAAAIAAASTPATVSVPATLTVNPWDTAGLPSGWVQVVVVLGVAAVGWGAGRAFRR